MRISCTSLNMSTRDRKYWENEAKKLGMKSYKMRDDDELEWMVKRLKVERSIPLWPKDGGWTRYGRPALPPKRILDSMTADEKRRVIRNFRAAQRRRSKSRSGSRSKKYNKSRSRSSKSRSTRSKKSYVRSRSKSRKRK